VLSRRGSHRRTNRVSHFSTDIRICRGAAFPLVPHPAYSCLIEQCAPCLTCVPVILVEFVRDGRSGGPGPDGPVVPDDGDSFGGVLLVVSVGRL